MREELAHVLWLGGAPRAGKTTLSRLLAGKYDLKIYNLDWHHVREHRLRPGGAPEAWEALSMDERWLHPTPAELLDRSIAVWTACFAFVVEDLGALPRTRPILAEGPGALPWCVAPLLTSSRQAIWLLPTAEFRDRDLLLGGRIAKSSGELGLTCVEMDGERSIDESLALVEAHFAPLLPPTLNV